MTTRSTISKIKKIDVTDYKHELSRGLFITEHHLQGISGNHYALEIKHVIKYNNFFELNSKITKTMNRSFLRIKAWLNTFYDKTNSSSGSIIISGSTW